VSRLLRLAAKELRQHALTGVGLFAVLAVAWLIVLATVAWGAQSLTLLRTHFVFTAGFLPLAGLVLGNRLVVAEWFGRTQLFLEALPVRRWEPVLVKLVLGLGVLLAAALASLGCSALAAAGDEPLGARFLGIMAVRTAAFVAWLWSFLFVMGLTGRFRIPLYLLLGVCLIVVTAFTDLELQRFGPFAALRDVELERRSLPTAPVLETLAMAAGFVAVAFGLALVAEGSVAESLAKRMSQREKVVVGLLLVATMAAVALLEERREKEPFAFRADGVVPAEALPIEVLAQDPERRADAEALVGRLERDLAALQDAMGWETLPPVRVAYRAGLDGRTFEEATLRENEGVLLRANFARTPEWDPTAFSAYALRAALVEATRGRAEHEPRAWLLDGFARWWSERGGDPSGPPLAPGDRALLRGVWSAAAGRGPTAERLRRWRRTREALGPPVAEGLAYAGLLTLEARRGREAVVALGRAAFGAAPPDDVRATLAAWLEPPEAAFAAATGWSFGAFRSAWAAELDRLAADPEVRAALEAVPAGEAEVTVEAGEGAIRDVVYRLRFARPPPAGVLCALLHDELGPFDDPLVERELRREEHTWPADAREATWRLSGRYGPGQRVFLAVQVEAPALGCPLRLAATRQEVR